MGATRSALVYYTTSRTEFLGAKRPRQFLFVNERRARELGQSVAFHVDASRSALLPITRDYFPELMDERIPVRGRDPAFVAVVERRTEELRAEGFRIEQAHGV
jgi:hypothetical protein